MQAARTRTQVVEDVREECKKHGGVLQVVIPRPGDGLDVPGVGRAFIHFETLDGSSLAQEDLDGRHFGENVVKASFITEEAFQEFANSVV
jgi:splicing factor U2AF subunit